MGAASGVRWKASVQRYLARVMRNISRDRRDLLAGRDIRRGLVEFDVFERGKRRHICSVRFSERVIQKSVSRNVLAPAIWPTLSAGCSANIAGRGTDYAIRRLKRQLARHYRRHGPEGYVLLIDFSSYFANIDHAACMRLVDRAIDDERVKELLTDQIAAYGECGLGLGSEPNQILAVALPSPIDRICESFPGVEAHGRYMDDSYLIGPDKDALWCALARVEMECARLGIVMNPRKTRMVKLTRGFTFLKKRFSFGLNGRIVVRPCRSAVTRERRKLRKLASLVRRGLMTRDQAAASYRSWRASMGRLDAHGTVLRMDALFRELFG